MTFGWIATLLGKDANPSAGPGPAAVTAEAEHEGFTIRAAPFRSEDGQFQTAGSIRLTVDGAVREHAFVRADRFASLDDATAFSLRKGRQIVDEQGTRLFPPA